MNAITVIHVVISFIALFAGIVIAWGMLTGKELRIWQGIFLVTNVLTSATGFLFPFVKLLPSHILAVLSLIVLALASYAYYGARLAGHWRTIYATTAMIAFYLNFFVLIVQGFLKVPALKALAPTQKEPPFLVAQTMALIAFAILGYQVTKRFKGKSLAGL